MKTTLFILLLFLIISCDENPAVLQKADKPTSSNISFTPETIKLSPFLNDYKIIFKGVDFNKNKVDSIYFEKNKLVIENADTDSLTANLTKKDTGDFRIFLYFNSGLVILDKKIHILPIEYKEPSFDNIVFTPDTIKLSYENSDSRIIFKGTDFWKYNIDSIFINDIPVTITFKLKDSLITNISKLITGTFDVNLYYKGNKITLNKKFVIINPYLDFDYTIFRKFSIEINNLKCLEERISNQWNGPTRTSEKKTQEINFDYSIIKNALYSNMASLNKFVMGSSNLFNGTSSLLVEFDFDNKSIKRIEYDSSDWYQDQDYNNISFSINIKLENIPYKISQNYENKPELVINLEGYSIDNFYPLIKRTNVFDDWMGNQKSYSSEKYISKVDSLSGKEINYYPANENSKIRFVLY